MSKYLTTKKDSLEDMVAKVSEGKQSEDYKQLFKKELEKTGKGVGSMSDIEKKAFFNNIDKKHKAKNEGSKEIQTKNMRTTPGEGTGAAGGKKLKEEVELEEGGVPARFGLSNSEKMKLAKDFDKLASDRTTSPNEKIYYKNTAKYFMGNMPDKAFNDMMGGAPKHIGGTIGRKTSAIIGKDKTKEVISGFKEESEIQEGGVKDFLMDVEDDAAHMSLNDLIKKYYGQMGLSAQEIKKIYYRVNEELTAGQKKLPPALQKAIKDKEQKEELNQDDKSAVKKVKDMLKGASAKHAAQAKMLDKAMKNEGLDDKDTKAVKDVVKGLKGAVAAHGQQVKKLDKALKSEADAKGDKINQGRLDMVKKGEKKPVDPEPKIGKSIKEMMKKKKR